MHPLEKLKDEYSLIKPWFNSNWYGKVGEINFAIMNSGVKELM